MTDVGGRLRQRRKSLGLTQADLASSVGVTFQQIQKYEKGVNAISQSRLRQICDVLKVPESFFTSGQGGLIGKAAPADGQPDLMSNQEAMAAFLQSGEGRRLVETFSRIKDHQLRIRILDFIAAIEGDQGK